ncbi:MAG TPA: GatB/YqeY domain-containing protein [Thermoleophilaceae bacterium]|nr:GatB/YqeY domain-containing protein [Thermoleophilaceae bacterium]
MAVLDQLQSDANAALKAGDRERAGALRVVLSELQKAVKEGGDDEIAVLQRERKRRLESAEAFREGGRDELAGEAERDAELIASYLPEQISEAELKALVADAVAQAGATSPKDMGKVMSIVMPQVQGRADGKRVSGAAKELLAG